MISAFANGGATYLQVLVGCLTLSTWLPLTDHGCKLLQVRVCFYQYAVLGDTCAGMHVCITRLC